MYTFFSMIQYNEPNARKLIKNSYMHVYIILHKSETLAEIIQIHGAF